MTTSINLQFPTARSCQIPESSQLDKPRSTQYFNTKNYKYSAESLSYMTSTTNSMNIDSRMHMIRTLKPQIKDQLLFSWPKFNISNHPLKCQRNIPNSEN